MREAIRSTTVMAQYFRPRYTRTFVLTAASRQWYCCENTQDDSLTTRWRAAVLNIGGSATAWIRAHSRAPRCRAATRCPSCRPRIWDAPRHTSPPWRGSLDRFPVCRAISTHMHRKNLMANASECEFRASRRRVDGCFLSGAQAGARGDGAHSLRPPAQRTRMPLPNLLRDCD